MDMSYYITSATQTYQVSNRKPGL